MAIRKILGVDEETLRKSSRVVTNFDQRLWHLLDDMAQTMYAADGVGLAAPQVGILRRCAIIDDGECGLIELVNPEIIEAGGVVEGEEGCLSLPGRRGLVSRANQLYVRACDRKGHVKDYYPEAYLARIFAHEIDHLNGVLYVDKMIRDVTEEAK